MLLLNMIKAVKKLSEIAKILMYIARVLVIAIGGGSGLLRIVKGKSDENPKEFNEGLMSIGLAGAIFAASFAITAAFE